MGYRKWKLLTIFTKKPILDVWQGFAYASEDIALRVLKSFQALKCINAESFYLYNSLAVNGLKKWKFNFHDGVAYHIEISPLICSANQRTGSYLIETSVMKELRTTFSGSFNLLLILFVNLFVYVEELLFISWFFYFQKCFSVE